MIRTGWRIAPEEKAGTAFDGEGARLYGGRWNPAGVPMVYGSEHQSLAALEVRVHIDKTSLHKRYRCFSFRFDDRLLEVLPARALPKNWREEPPPPLLQELGGAWANSGRSAILAVPSVIIPAERNYLINPRHPAFSKIRIDPPTKFSFDHRLLA